jgi:hypothetical protein
MHQVNSIDVCSRRACELLEKSRILELVKEEDSRFGSVFLIPVYATPREFPLRLGRSVQVLGKHSLGQSASGTSRSLS